jgi:WD40 repeat protein
MFLMYHVFDRVRSSDLEVSLVGRQKTKTLYGCTLKLGSCLAMRNRVITLILLALLCVSCGLEETQIATRTQGPGVLLPTPWTSTPTTLKATREGLTRTPEGGPAITSTRIPFSVATRTATPSKTLTPFPTPSTPLYEQGPWLLGSAGNQLVAMNPDGTGLTALNILSRVWSTTGWVAAREYTDLFSPVDLSIRIVRLPSEEPVRTIRLLSEELTTRIEESEDWDPYLAPDVYQAVLTDRLTMRWSPDGRYLAFIAAMDGPSADLYVYDIQTDQVSRLTDGPDQAVLMEWSPDGRWIVHMEATDFFTGIGGFASHISPKAIWAASVDGSEVKKLYDVEGGEELITGWRAPSVFVVLRSYGSSPPSDLRSVDINSGRVFNLYEPEAYPIAVDGRTGAVAYVAIPMGEGPEEQGLYLLRAGEDSPVKIDVGEWVIPQQVMWSPDTGLFYAQLGREIVVFNSSGEIRMTIEEETLPTPSPDGQWLAFARRDDTGEQSGLRLYTSDGEFLRDLSHERVSGLIWSPDSIRIFFSERLPVGDGYAVRLMYATVAEGDPRVVHPNPGASFFAWVEP